MVSKIIKYYVLTVYKNGEKICVGRIRDREPELFDGYFVGEAEDGTINGVHMEGVKFYKVVPVTDESAP